MKSKFITSTDGTKIAYNVSGKGYPLVLAHGMGSNKEMWKNRKWIDIFENYFTVIAIDIRGNGESNKSYYSDFYLVNNIIDDIDLVVKECGFNEYNYFGHSYGATIGLQLCKQRRNIKRIVCGGTTFGNKFFKEVVPEWIAEYEYFDLKKKNNTLHELDLSEEDIEWMKKTDFNLALAQLNAWKYWNGVEVNDIKTNMAIYSGTKDYSQVLENLNANKTEIEENNIALKIFENLNHTELVSKPDIVSPCALEFLLS